MAYSAHFSAPIQLQFSALTHESVQVLNSNKHWVCVSTIGCSPGHINVYDSLFSTPPPALVQQVCNLLHTSETKVVVQVMDVQLQSGGNNCGLFAVANAVSPCCGTDPSSITYDQELVRQHLDQCLSTRQLTPFPSKKRKPTTTVKRTFEYR